MIKVKIKPIPALRLKSLFFHIAESGFLHSRAFFTYKTLFEFEFPNLQKNFCLEQSFFSTDGNGNTFFSPSVFTARVLVSRGYKYSVFVDDKPTVYYRLQLLPCRSSVLGCEIAKVKMLKREIVIDS